MAIATLETTLRPVRGIIPTHTIHGKPFRIVDAHRWLNYAFREFGVLKLDLLGWGPMPDRMLGLLDFVLEQLPLPLSLRTDSTESPAGLALWAKRGLFDVCLSPPPDRPSHVDEWVDACRELGLPIRMQWQAPCVLDGDAEARAAHWADSNVCAVSFVVTDPFHPFRGTVSADQAHRCVQSYNRIARALAARDVEVNFFGFPLEILDEINRAGAGSRADYFRDHQQYEPGSYAMATDLFRRNPMVVRSVILAHMARHASFDNPIDKYLVKFLTRYPKSLYAPATFVSKTWRTFFAQGHVLPDPETSQESADQSILSGEEWETFQRVLPGFHAQPIPSSPRIPRRRYLDAVDLPRFHGDQQRIALARTALDWEQRTDPTRELQADLFGCDNAFFRYMPAANQWVTVSSGEKISNVLDHLSPPCMVSVTFGGGLAECVGFAFGRHVRLLCPMVNTAHVLHLYIDEYGQYVVLRDRIPVDLIAIPGKVRAPLRLPAILDVQLCVWNIHDEISASSIKVWQSPPERLAPTAPITYSICIFSTRFSRRLEAVLRCIAHQRDFDLRQLEILVAYVPGLDATEDVLDSIRRAYPQLRVLNIPFSGLYEKSKGFALNETMRMASGEWIVLLDSDILVPPEMFAMLDALRESHTFIAPIGRAMLDSDTTARILVGEVKPWEEWDRLRESAPEYREREAKGVPIGFCQIFRASCLRDLRYPEYEHFQGADWEFGRDMRERFGDEYRLPFPVLHLDHAGSQWYGTQQHF